MDNQMRPIRIIILTGMPGIGKTTLIKTVSKLLIEKKVTIAGFYTEEIRNAGKRIGFDVVTLDGKRGILARVMEHVDQSNISRYQVGQYNVNKDSFESLALPIFSAQECRVLVLDEIGRMELFSDDFKQSVKSALNNPLQVILATIPVAKGRPISFVEEIRQHPNAKVFIVDHRNRDFLSEQIMNMLLHVFGTSP